MTKAIPTLALDGIEQSNCCDVVDENNPLFEQLAFAIAIARVSGSPVPDTVTTTVVPRELNLGLKPKTNGAAKGAEHDALKPPVVPEQLQLHGPAPATLPALPALHKLAEGLCATATPFAEPQAPLTGTLGAIALP